MFKQIKDLDPHGLAKISHAVAFEGYTFKDFAKISDEQMESIYATAFNLVNTRKFEDAERLLEWLASMNQYEQKYLIGLGIARQQQQKYKDAVKAYAAATMLDVTNPIPPIRAAECFLALGQLKEAESGCRGALHWAGDVPEHGAIRERAELLLEAIQRKREGGV